jgi:uncharacterized protein YdhG (YjbR/CyaY superfamily)
VADSSVRALVARYAGPKGNLRFPLDEPIPYELIAKVVGARLQENLAKAASHDRAGAGGLPSRASGRSKPT